MAKYFRWFTGGTAIILGILAWGFSAGLVAAQQTQPAQFAQGWQAYEAGRYDEALQIWQRLADQGYPSAQINLGAMYDKGTGVPADPSTAVKWYRTAALNGDPYAQFNLGRMYAEGRGVSCNMAAAAAWYRQAAGQGLARAQYHLGLLYADSATNGTIHYQREGNFPCAPGKDSGDVKSQPAGENARAEDTTPHPSLAIQ
ncbi:MAG: SEL1-like repeat protein [Desulfobacterales bacterium]|nr:MAG: SEL1-like repeat protein [Desulfobacterales bacterium]